METLKSITSSLKNNWIGAIAGGALAYLAAKKKLNITNKLGLVGITAVGAVVGASVQYKIKAATTKPAIAASTKK